MWAVSSPGNLNKGKQGERQLSTNIYLLMICQAANQPMLLHCLPEHEELTVLFQTMSQDQSFLCCFLTGAPLQQWRKHCITSLMPCLKLHTEILHSCSGPAARRETQLLLTAWLQVIGLEHCPLQEKGDLTIYRKHGCLSLSSAATLAPFCFL